MEADRDLALHPVVTDSLDNPLYRFHLASTIGPSPLSGIDDFPLRLPDLPQNGLLRSWSSPAKFFLCSMHSTRQTLPIASLV